MKTTAHAARRLVPILIALGSLSLLFSAFSVITVLSAPLHTVTVPETIGFEGFLADGSGNPVADGTYSIVFKVYSTATGGTALVSQTHGTTPVTNGLYAVALGPFSPDPFAAGGDRWIGVTVGGGTEISPRSQVMAVPYALTAKQAGAVAWGDITCQSSPKEGQPSSAKVGQAQGLAAKKSPGRMRMRPS